MRLVWLALNAGVFSHMTCRSVAYNKRHRSSNPDSWIRLCNLAGTRPIGFQSLSYDLPNQLRNDNRAPSGELQRMHVVSVCLQYINIIWLPWRHPLKNGKWGIDPCFADVLFNDFWETNYLRIYWTDFAIFSPNNRYFVVDYRSDPVFFQSLKDVNQFWSKMFRRTIIQQLEI